MDIDECSGRNICDENAECFNEPGGYNCRCKSGYTGNGYTCDLPSTSYYQQPQESHDLNVQTEQYDYSQQQQQQQHLREQQQRQQQEYEEQLQREYEQRSSYDHAPNEYGSEQNSNSNQHESSSAPNVPSLAPDHWLCDQCSSDAICQQGICVCKNGFNGDGTECTYNCPNGYVWNVDKCEEIETDDNDEGIIY